MQKTSHIDFRRLERFHREAIGWRDCIVHDTYLGLSEKASCWKKSQLWQAGLFFGCWFGSWLKFLVFAFLFLALFSFFQVGGSEAINRIQHWFKQRKSTCEVDFTYVNSKPRNLTCCQLCKSTSGLFKYSQLQAFSNIPNLECLSYHWTITFVIQLVSLCSTKNYFHFQSCQTRHKTLYIVEW